MTEAKSRLWKLEQDNERLSRRFDDTRDFHKDYAIGMEDRVSKLELANKGLLANMVMVLEAVPQLRGMIERLNTWESSMKARLSDQEKRVQGAESTMLRAASGTTLAIEKVMTRLNEFIRDCEDIDRSGDTH